jgi:branched-chain amino acid transport system permease protein
VGLGAYTAALLNHYEGAPVWLCLIAGGAMAVVGGAVLAIPALRLRGPYFGLVTLVAVLMMQNLLVLFAGFTGGEIGLDIPSILTISDRWNYWYALLFMTISGGLMFGLSQSSVGLILQASGQDATQAAALGFNVAKHKLAAFCVSALFSGLAGAMLVFYLATVSVGTVVDLAIGVQFIIAAVLGGRRTIIGGAIGSIFLIGAAEILRPIGQLSTFVVSAVALIVILFFPGGFLGVALRGRERA